MLKCENADEKLWAAIEQRYSRGFRMNREKKIVSWARLSLYLLSLTVGRRPLLARLWYMVDVSSYRFANSTPDCRVFTRSVEQQSKQSISRNTRANLRSVDCLLIFLCLNTTTVRNFDSTILINSNFNVKKKQQKFICLHFYFQISSVGLIKPVNIVVILNNVNEQNSLNHWNFNRATIKRLIKNTRARKKGRKGLHFYLQIFTRQRHFYFLFFFV